MEQQISPHTDTGTRASWKSGRHSTTRSQQQKHVSRDRTPVTRNSPASVVALLLDRFVRHAVLSKQRLISTVWQVFLMHTVSSYMYMTTQLMRCLERQSNTTQPEGKAIATQLHPRQSFFKEKMSCLGWDSNPRPSVCSYHYTSTCIHVFRLSGHVRSWSDNQVSTLHVLVCTTSGGQSSISPSPQEGQGTGKGERAQDADNECGRHRGTSQREDAQEVSLQHIHWRRRQQAAEPLHV